MKPKHLSIAGLLVLLLLAASNSLAQPRSGQLAVTAADQAWLKVFAAKDLTRSVDFCTAGASVLAPNTPIAKGHDAISKLFATFFAIPGLTIEWKPAYSEIAKGGDMAYTTGVYHMGFTGPDGKPVMDTGKYVTVWKKERDGWKVQLDIFNSDQPPMGQ